MEISDVVMKKANKSIVKHGKGIGTACVNIMSDADGVLIMNKLSMNEKQVLIDHMAHAAQQAYYLGFNDGHAI